MQVLVEGKGLPTHPGSGRGAGPGMGWWWGRLPWRGGEGLAWRRVGAVSRGGKQLGQSCLEGSGDQQVPLSGWRTVLLEKACICQVSVACTTTRMHRERAWRRRSWVVTVDVRSCELQRQAMDAAVGDESVMACNT